MNLGTDNVDEDGNETVSVIIEANTPIPCSKTLTFKTAEDNTNFVSIKVLQGQSECVDECHLISTCKLDGIPPGPAGSQKIKVTYSVDSDGLLTVSAYSKSN